MIDLIPAVLNGYDLFRHAKEWVHDSLHGKHHMARLLVLSREDRPVPGARIVVNGIYVGETNQDGISDPFSTSKRDPIQFCIFKRRGHCTVIDLPASMVLSGMIVIRIPEPAPKASGAREAT